MQKIVDPARHLDIVAFAVDLENALVAGLGGDVGPHPHRLDEERLGEHTRDQLLLQAQLHRTGADAQGDIVGVDRRIAQIQVVSQQETMRRRHRGFGLELVVAASEREQLAHPIKHTLG